MLSRFQSNLTRYNKAKIYNRDNYQVRVGICAGPSHLPV